ncbi:hypothetical protein VPH35_010938 [Triticum aestivum]
MAADAKPPALTTLQNVPDRLLEPILVRLMSSPLCLVRAAATCNCKRWRRIMGRSWFFFTELHKARSRAPYPRPVAGNYYNRVSPLGGRETVFVPTALTAQHGVQSRRFSLDFLPGGSRKWEIVDSGGSLVLLAKKKKSGWMRRCFPDLLVCEPATRRYQLIPRMEEMKRHRCLGSYLVGTERRHEFKPDIGVHVVDSMETFKVVCVVYQQYDGVCDEIGSARACFFARDSKSQARRGRHETHSWYAEQSRNLGHNFCLHGTELLHFLGHAGYSLFWSIEGQKERMLTYGPRWLPHGFKGTALRVMDDSTRQNIRFVCLQGNTLQIFVRPTITYLGNAWVLHKSLELMEATRGLEGYKGEYFEDSLKVVVTSPKSVVLAPANGTWLFSVDLDTMEVAKRNHKTTDHLGLRDYPCELPWPPTIRACVTCIEDCVRQEQGPCSHICIC